MSWCQGGGSMILNSQHSSDDVTNELTGGDINVNRERAGAGVVAEYI